jgi:CubicO group peptidase (beta-lactamase class C family)
VVAGPGVAAGSQVGVMRRAWLTYLTLALALVPAPRAGSAAAAPDLDATLASPDAAQREAALARLIATRDARPELLPRFARLLDDPDLAVAGKAAMALALRGDEARPLLAQLLAEGSSQQRWGATVALCQTNGDLRPFLPTLTRQLAEPDVRLVHASLAALARLEADAAAALPALRTLLRHEDAEIRHAALVTLGAIGPAADDAVLDITAFLGDAAAELRLAAADAMRRIRPPAPIEASQLAAHLDWLRTELPVLIREHHVPGVSVAVIEHGELRWSQGFGVADARTGKAVTVETVFEAASMSKPVFALLAVQLVQDGRLDLDRPLVEYLGRDYLPHQPAHRRITARMALTHRTGLENWRAGYDEMGGPLALNFPPGSEYTYSGEGILFLQRALEAITGQPLERQAQERLFGPLGLARTSFVWTEALEPDLASGHGEDGGFKERTRYRKANGAYSLYTTPTEYARLMMSLMRPQIMGKRAFTPAGIELMLARELRLGDDETLARPGLAQAVATYRALGFKLDVTPEGDIAWHTGANSSGFRTLGQFNPAKGSGLVVFTNGDGGSRVSAAILERIGDL